MTLRQAQGKRLRKWTTMIACLAVVACAAGCAMLPGGARAREAQELNTVRLVALACYNYAATYRDVLPSSTADLVPFIGDDVDLDQYELVARGKLSAITSPGTAVLVRSKSVLPSGMRAVAFVDGHAELVKWSSRQATAGIAAARC